MYPENSEGTRVIVGSMNMEYVSDTARTRTCNLFSLKCVQIPLAHSDEVRAMSAKQTIYTLSYRGLLPDTASSTCSKAQSRLVKYLEECIGAAGGKNALWFWVNIKRCFHVKSTQSKTSPSPKWFIFGMVIGHGEKKNFVKFFYFSVKRFPRYGSLNFDRNGRNRDGQAMVKCLYLSFYGT